MKNQLLFLLLVLGGVSTYGQVGVGTPLPNSSAQLDVVASTKGILIPRVNLINATSMSPITNDGSLPPSLMVFNTASQADVKPGYYYWYDNKWNRIVVSNEITSSKGTVIFNPISQEFTYIDASGAPQIITLDGLKGDKGDDGKDFKFTDFTSEQLATLKGDEGPIGPAGAAPTSGAGNVTGLNLIDITNGVNNAFQDTNISLRAGNPGQILQTVGTIPTWVDTKVAIAQGTTNDLKLDADNKLISNVNGVTSSVELDKIVAQVTTNDLKLDADNKLISNV
ncbi:hypothetical protein ACFFUQ_20370, partial [Flavobacterium branchiarum]